MRYILENVTRDLIIRDALIDRLWTGISQFLAISVLTGDRQSASHSSTRQAGLPRASARHAQQHRGVVMDTLTIRILIYR